MFILFSVITYRGGFIPFLICFLSTFASFRRAAFAGRPPASTPYRGKRGVRLQGIVKKWSGGGGNGVLERCSNGTGGNGESRGKKSRCPDFAPGLVPAIALVLLPIPIRSPKPIQQTSFSAPNHNPQRRLSRTTRLSEGNWAGITSSLCCLRKVQPVLIPTIMANDWLAYSQ
jgi:hypothetical protein